MLLLLSIPPKIPDALTESRLFLLFPDDGHFGSREGQDHTRASALTLHFQSEIAFQVTEHRSARSKEVLPTLKTANNWIFFTPRQAIERNCL